MTELGAAVGSAAAGVLDRFEAVIRPIGDAVVTSRDSFERASSRGRSTPATRCSGSPAGARPTASGAPASSPGRPPSTGRGSSSTPGRYLGDNPFGFKAVCASSWFEARGRRFEVELPHVAVEDAEIQLRHFLTEARAAATLLT